MSSSDKFYNRFSFFYPLADLFLKRQKKELFLEVNSLPAGKLLEIGVGNGAHFNLYTKHEITGIDSSEKMLSIAKKQAGDHIELVQMNGEQLLFADQSFDYIVLSHVIAVVEDPEQLLVEAHRVMKPGGSLFILNHFTPCNWLRYIDRAFSIFAKQFHFRSVFYVNDLTALEKFVLLKETGLGWRSYFKLLICRKP